jgi:transposase
MAISKDLIAEIIRLHHAEKWLVGTIARQLGVHPSVVRRVLAQETLVFARAPRGRKIDPYIDFISETLRQFPTLTASRLFQMVEQRGFTGKISQFRAVVAEMRPKRREAFLRLVRQPGEEAQVDWAHFGKLVCDGYERPLVAFVMTLAYSRAIYVRFFLSQGMSSFLTGHEGAFAWFGGIPRACLYDNLKSVVLERIGNAIKRNPQFVAYAQHCRFETRVAAPARGNEKGRTERAIRYLRENFFAGREYRDLDDLNKQALEWCETRALERPWQDDATKKVRDALREERTLLLPLRDIPYPCEERREVRVGKTPYIRFDLNDYSIPHQYTQSVVTVIASEITVRVVVGTQEVAKHTRRYGRGTTTHALEHLEALREWKHQARDELHGNHYIIQHLPSAQALLQRLTQREYSLQRAQGDLKRLLPLYGAQELEQVIQETLRSEAPSMQMVTQLLEARRQDAGGKPALPLVLPDHVAQHDTTPVIQHSLQHYDTVGTHSTEETKEKNRDTAKQQ